MVTPDARILASLAATILAVFSALAALVVLSSSPSAADRAIYLLLRGEAETGRGPWWVEVAMRDLSSLGSPSVTVLAALGATGAMLLRGRGRSTLFLVTSVGGALLLERGLKGLFGRARPELAPHLVETLSLGFPSGHALLASATCLSLGLLVWASDTRSRREVRYICALAAGGAMLVGVTRIYLGVHWPSDVLAGWCVGAAWTLLCAVLTGLCRGSRRKK